MKILVSSIKQRDVDHFEMVYNYYMPVLYRFAMQYAYDSETAKVYTQLSQRAPLTTWLQVKSAGLVDITLEIEVTGKKSYMNPAPI